MYSGAIFKEIDCYLDNFDSSSIGCFKNTCQKGNDRWKEPKYIYIFL